MAVRFKNISTLSELEAAVEFFSGQSKNEASENPDFPVRQIWEGGARKCDLPYGLIAEEEENGSSRIVGVIFFVYQGQFSVDQKYKRIINMSSWFVDPEFHGILPLQMFKRVSKILNNCIITNYTPNQPVRSILKGFRYKDMPVKRWFFNPFNWRSLFKHGKLSTISPDRANKEIPGWSAPVSPDTQATFWEFETPGGKIYFGGIARLHQRQIGPISITMKSIMINWISDEQKFAKSAPAITLRLCIKNRVHFISTYLHEDISVKGARQGENIFMISNPTEGKWLQPIASELFL